MIMNIDIKTYSYSKIKTFVNLRYLSMRISDLIFKMLSYFAYNFLMVLIITFQIFMMQVNPFEVEPSPFFGQYSRQLHKVFRMNHIRALAHRERSAPSSVNLRF